MFSLLLFSSSGWRAGARISDSPDGVSGIVGDQQRAAAVHGDADRAAPCLAILIEEAGDKPHRLAHRTSAGEANEGDAITAVGSPIPAAVLANEGAAAEHRREAVAGVESQPDRCDVR